MRALRLAALALSCTLAAASGLDAQIHPNVARGPASAPSLEVGQVDNVNLFNGNLSLSIPIGQSYPAGGSLSYGVTLTYNSDVWEVSQLSEPCGGEMCTYSAMDPDPDFNAGLGWQIHFGRLEVRSGRFHYIAPDGSRHDFYDTLHEGESQTTYYEYSRDGSYLRLHCPTANCDQAGDATVEFPDGTTHRFDANGDVWKIEDRKGNYLQIGRTANRWSLWDRFGRQHYIDFATVAGTKVVTSVDLAGFSNNRTVWTFAYDTRTICRSPLDNWPYNSTSVTVPLLKTVSGPEGTSWKMLDGTSAAYYDGKYPSCYFGSPNVSGTLQRIELPTRGTIDYSYRVWGFPTAGLDPGFAQNFGVASRAVTDPFGASGTWTYVEESGASGEVVRRVQDPAGNSVRHYFATPTILNTSNWTGWEYGLPFTKNTQLGSNGLYKSQEYLQGSSSVLRTVWMSYTHDILPAALPPEYQHAFDRWYNTNRRPTGQRTRFDEDGSKYVDASSSRFDGLGHFRDATTSGNFNGTQSRTERTEFNPNSGCYDVNLATNQQTCTGGQAFQMIPTGSPWLLETYSYKRQTEGTTAEQQFVFDGAGLVTCQRTLRTGTNRSSSDVVAIFDRDSLGQVTAEKYYGGDTQALATTAGCPTPSTWTYRVDHGYAYGALASSQYRRPAGTLMPFKSFEATIDGNTGLVKEEWDPAGFKTTYDYDDLGRMTLSEPAGNPAANQLARTYYGYTAASGGSNGRAKVSVTVNCPQGASSCTSPLAERQYQYDGFGRLVVERVKRDTGAWSRRETAYNALGWKTGESGWGPDTGSLPWTDYLSFDPFGRPGTIRPPDTTSHNITLGYTGNRVVQRTVKIATSLTGSEQSFSTWEHSDTFGRLAKVEQALDGAFTQSTTYAYDVGNRLKSVNQNGKNGAATVSQNRYFTYDNRGFLTSETHPEKGPSGNGSVTYQSYDARGHAGTLLDGSSTNASWMSYDPAERLLEVREDNASGRLLKRYTYDDGWGAYANGKVGTATGYTHLWTGSWVTVEVRETYQYDGRGGLPSARETRAWIAGNNLDTFVQYWGWNPLGDLDSETYPSWTFGPTRQMTSWFGYANGFLDAISGTRFGANKSYSSDLGYHDNLTLASVAHANAVTDTIVKDPFGLARPNRIYTSNVNAGLNFDSGTYSYDGAGNIEAMGSDKYRYDGASRLLEGSLSVGGVGRSQSYVYDSWGNLTSITTNGSTRNTPTAYQTNRLTGGTYDAAGNLTSYNGTTYVYDRANHLVRMTHPGVSAPEDWLFAYTADDERVVSFCLTGESQDLFKWTIRNLSGNVVREFRSGGGTTADVYLDHVYRGDQLLATEVRNTNGTYSTRHMTLDHLGSPRLVTDDFKNRLAEHEYYPYGEEATTAANPVNLRFTAHERDYFANGGATPAQDDLDYLHARFFNPVPGRFVSVDQAEPNPHRPMQWNRYFYAGGNPLAHYDPDGRSPIRYWLKGARGVFRLVKRNVLVRRSGELAHGAKVTGRGAAQEARRVARDANPGKEIIRHDAHKSGELPHFQPKSGKRGHVGYEVEGVVVVTAGLGASAADAIEKATGSSLLAKGSGFVIDFFNPIADVLEAERLLEDVGIATIESSYGVLLVNDAEGATRPERDEGAPKLVSTGGQICTATGACF